MSPAAQSMPSPANWPNSPMYRPSPRPAQSPAAQQHNTGGNSLSQQNGPGSVGSSNVHTMRVSPARNLSPAAFPTILTQAGFEAMCRSNAPNENPSFEGNATFAQLSHLERFLGCVFMHKNLRQFIIKPDCPLTLIQTTELGAIQFKDKNELFHFKIQMHPDTMQNLQIKITSLDRSHNISQDEIETVERFFELKVISEPFKPDAFMTFARILNVPLKFVKDFIQLMRLELYPDRGFKWALNWCLTISPGTMMRTPGPQLPFGMSAFVNPATQFHHSVVFFLQLTQLFQGAPPIQGAQQLAFPIIWDNRTNSLNIPAKDQTMAAMPIISTINQILQEAPNRGEFPIYSSIREVLCSDLVPPVPPL